MFSSVTVNDVNLFLFFLVVFLFLFLSFKSIISLLLISEIFWISFYFLSLLIAFQFDACSFIALSLFCLIFSSVEITVGLSLIDLKLKSTNSTTLNLKK